MSTARHLDLGSEYAADADVTLEAKVQALQSPAAYEDCPRSVESVETHFAWVFLTDELAYKLKKPARTDYMDLTGIAARQFDCAEEVRLNRRLAPDTYLGVRPLVRAPDGSLRVNGSGQVLDWLVLMRRLPSSSQLSRAIATRTASAAALTEVGRTLAEFYRQQRCIDFEPVAYVERMAAQIREDRKALYARELQLDPERICSATAKVWCAFAATEAELSTRALERRIVEAHGDLRPEHIFLGHPPRIIDALEFSLDLRTLDPGEELAFLRMECARAGGAREAQAILESCLQSCSDPISVRLLQFYESRRAMVRAKLMAWHLCDPKLSALAPWREQAHSYLDHAEACAGQAI
jgi:uncharacterized protein